MQHDVPHDWDAASYDRVAEPQTRWGRAVTSWLELGGDERVVDAGCGTGRVTEALLARLPHGRVIALDGSAAMVAAARSRLAGTGAHLAPVVADLRDPLPIAPGSLDALVSTATFHWLPDHDALFHHLARILRPGAQLAAECGGPGNIASVVAALRRLAPGEGYPWTYPSPEDTRRRLERAGFAEVETWLTEERTPFASRAELESFLGTVILWPQLEQRGRSEHAPFVTRVADELPGVELDYVRLNMRARRR
jgi:trans-aconitate 2-methyltransferase